MMSGLSEPQTRSLRINSKAFFWRRLSLSLTSSDHSKNENGQQSFPFFSKPQWSAPVSAVLALTQETFEWTIWMCRQAGKDICRRAGGQREFGWSSWLGGAPRLPSVPLLELGKLATFEDKAEPLLCVRNSPGCHFPCYLFTSVCKTSLTER